MIFRWVADALRLFYGRLVDLRTVFIDHHHASVLIVADDVERDMMRDQVGGFPCVVLTRAIKPDRVFEPKTVGDVEMENRHWHFPSRGQCTAAKRVPADNPKAGRRRKLSVRNNVGFPKPLVPERATILAGIGAAGQGALVPIDPDRLRAAERRHYAGGLVAELLQALDDIGRHAILKLIDTIIMQ